MRKGLEDSKRFRIKPECLTRRFFFTFAPTGEELKLELECWRNLHPVEQKYLMYGLNVLAMQLKC